MKTFTFLLLLSIQMYSFAFSQDGNTAILSGKVLLLGIKSEEPQKHFSFYLSKWQSPSNKNYIIETDSSGSFYVDTIPPGEYTAGIDEKLDVVMSEDQDRFLYLGERGNNELNLYLRPKNTLKGILLDEHNEPIEGTTIDLLPVIPVPNETYQIKTDRSGEFEFHNLLEGKYRLGANISNAPSHRSPYPPTIYNYDDSKETAEPLEIKRGTQLTGLVIKVKKTLTKQTITGRIITADGTPWKNAHVLLTKDPEGKEKVAGSQTETGSFRIEALDFPNGWLRVKPTYMPDTTSYWWKPLRPEPIKIEGSEDFNNIVVTIKLEKMGKFTPYPPAKDPGWFIRKVSNKEFFLPDKSNYSRYKSLKALFRKWYPFDELNEYRFMFPDVPPEVLSVVPDYSIGKNQITEFFPDGRVRITYTPEHFPAFSFDLRWRMYIKDKSLIAFIAPNDDIIIMVEIVSLEKDKLAIRYNGIITYNFNKETVHITSQQNYNHSSRKASDFECKLVE